MLGGSQTAGSARPGNEYPSNEQQINLKWFRDLSILDLISMAMCVRGCVWGLRGVLAIQENRDDLS